LTCSAVGTTLTEDGDDYGCSGSACSASSTTTCNSYSCGSGNECNSQSCAGTSYTCYYSNGGSYAWTSGSPPAETACTDGYDNDCDGLTDTGDTDCTFQATFSQSGIPAGTIWGVTVDGSPYTSTSFSLTVPGLFGTVAYSYNDPVSGVVGIQYDCTSGCSGSVTESSPNGAASYTTQYHLTMQANPPAGGTISPSSGWYDTGSPVTISTTANAGYTFSDWTGSGSGSYSGTSPSSPITMNGPITETANFAACSDDCSPSGSQEQQCNSDIVQIRTCGQYDADSCLEWSTWSDVEDCANRAAPCDYGTCDTTEIPVWSCSLGSCVYSCDYGPTCTQIVMEVIDYAAVEISETEMSFTIDWNVTYNPPAQHDITVECVINCDQETEDCSAAEQCLPSPSTLPAGDIGGCAVTNPTLLPKKIYGSDEFFSCKMYNPIYPEYPSYKKIIYSSLDFSFSVSGMSANAGESFNLPVGITNLGLISDNYHVVVEPLAASASYVTVENGDVYTEVATTDEAAIVYPRVTVLVARPVFLGITITSEAEPLVMEYREIQITGGVVSMPEFGLFGLLQIMIIAVAIVVSKTIF